MFSYCQSTSTQVRWLPQLMISLHSLENVEAEKHSAQALKKGETNTVASNLAKSYVYLQSFEFKPSRMKRNPSRLLLIILRVQMVYYPQNQNILVLNKNTPSMRSK